MNPIFRNIVPRVRSFLNGKLGQIRAEHTKIDPNAHKVNSLERKFLVWTGKYKTVAEVPDFVPQNVVERARNRMRIRIANLMMAATLLGCLAMAWAGKEAAKRGESVQQQNLDWHREIKETERKQ